MIILRINSKGVFMKIDAVEYKFKNELMDLNNRLKHEDISAIIDSFIENISEYTAKLLDSSTTIDEALSILGNKILKLKNGIPQADKEYKYINIQILDSLMNEKEIKEKILIPLLT